MGSFLFHFEQILPQNTSRCTNINLKEDIKCWSRKREVIKWIKDK